MRFDPLQLPPAVAAFLTERHLASLTTLRAPGRPHVAPVGFTWDGAGGVARVITSGTSQKVANVRRHPEGHVVLCQVEGRRWVSLEGAAAILDDPAAVRDAEDRYELRYRRPRANAARVVLAIAVERVLGSAPPAVTGR